MVAATGSPAARRRRGRLTIPAGAVSRVRDRGIVSRRRRPTALALLALAALVAVGVCPIRAQEPWFPPGGEEPPPTQEPPPAQASGAPIYGSVGLNLAGEFPQGEFAENTGTGAGLTGNLSIRLLRSGLLGVRLDAGWISYGSRTRNETIFVSGVPFSVETTTTNEFLQLGIGPQLQLSGDPVSARAYALIGTTRFSTQTELKETGGGSDGGDRAIDSFTHLSDWTGSFTLGGGLRWSIGGDREGVHFGLALNAEWRRHGTTRYLNESSIEIGEDGRADFMPFESRIDFLVVSLGVWAGNW